ncbi:hypothetical protein FCR2A7T_16660 [Flavobacterium cauense R2A-7]|nr:hypothetical protein [Flavobacterium cauense]ESU19511.1 hypothetical protein FCR2A7T_16660 [Flavobacterium cauense R2A-7]
MKNIIVFLFSVCCFAQQQFRTSDFGYSDDVVKVEECLYKFHPDERVFKVQNSYTTAFEKSYFKKQKIASFFDEGSSVGEYHYTYNKDKTIAAIVYKPVNGSFGKLTEIHFQYEKGKLKRMVIAGISNTDYEYDAKGNLRKETEKDLYGNVTEIADYFKYTAPKTYEKTKISYDANKKVTFTTKETFVNGKVVLKTAQSETLTWKNTFEYDSYGNLIHQLYDDASELRYHYEFDAKNNRIKIAKLSPSQPEDHSFTFVKITYADGTISGDTAVDYDFIKKHDKVFRERDSLLQHHRKVTYSGNSKGYLQLLKGENSDFEVQDTYDNDFTKVVKLLPSPVDYHAIVFCEVDNSTHFAKEFFADTFERHRWFDLEQVSSPTGMFWMKNEKNKIFIYKSGQFLSTANFSVKPDASDEKDLLLNDGINNPYLLKAVDEVEVGKLYPIYKK